MGMFDEAITVLRSADGYPDKKLANIVKASVYILGVQKANQFVPDWAIQKTCEAFNLTDTEARHIRDIIQNNS